MRQSDRDTAHELRAIVLCGALDARVEPLRVFIEGTISVQKCITVGYYSLCILVISFRFLLVLGLTHIYIVW